MSVSQGTKPQKFKSKVTLMMILKRMMIFITLKLNTLMDRLQVMDTTMIRTIILMIIIIIESIFKNNFDLF